jgi:hypothetical protein
MKFRYSSILFLILVIGFAELEGNQKPEWKGKIETENGIKVIKNPREPLYGNITFDLKEDLNIGRERDKNYAFNGVRGVAVDNQGNVYVTDMNNQRVQKFGRNGKFLMTIGMNEGSGKFTQPTKVLINETNGDIYVLDHEKIKIFDKEGKHISDVIPKEFPLDFIFDGTGVIYANLALQTESREHFRNFCKLDSNGEIIKIYAKVPFQSIVTDRFGGSGHTGFEFDLFITNIDSQTFLYGFSKEYILNVIDREGNLVFIINKDEPPHEFPPDEKRRYSKLPIIFNPLPNIPFFYSLLTDSTKRIYVQTNRLTPTKPEVDKEFDVFSQDGYYLYKTRLPRYTRAIKDGFLYAEIANHIELAKRYKIKNWDQIKRGISD